MRVAHIVALAFPLGLAAPAFAFDNPPPIDAPEYTGSIAAASGWYIRGDLGYSARINGDTASYRSIDATGASTTNSFDNQRFARDFSVSAGAGYQFNDFLRSDATVDYFSTTSKGKSGWETPCTYSTGEGAFGGCSYRQQAVSALGLLANGYVDLGTYWGLTPYVGAGAGVSYVKWGDVQESYRCYYSKKPSDCNGINYKQAKKEGADSWRFTYAVMAGVSYDVAQNIKLDLGYRYTRIGEGDMFNFSSYEKDLGAFGMKATDKGIDRSEFRAGLRMTGW
jgi:opacity protein-like surface antigen